MAGRTYCIKKSGPVSGCEKLEIAPGSGRIWKFLEESAVSLLARQLADSRLHACEVQIVIYRRHWVKDKGGIFSEKYCYAAKVRSLLLHLWS